jgi:hypothetical protein
MFENIKLKTIATRFNFGDDVQTLIPQVQSSIARVHLIVEVTKTWKPDSPEEPDSSKNQEEKRNVTTEMKKRMYSLTV